MREQICIKAKGVKGTLMISGRALEISWNSNSLVRKVQSGSTAIEEKTVSTKS